MNTKLINWRSFIVLLMGYFNTSAPKSQNGWLKKYDVVWNTQSKNSSGSMPNGGFET